MNINEIERERAKFAFKKVTEVKDEKFASEYKSYVKKMPIYIKTNGLLSALVFAFSKEKKDNGKTAWGYLLEHFIQYTYQDEILKSLFKNRTKLNSEMLIKEVTTLNVEKYLLISSQIIAFSNWLRRFAEGMIDEDNDSSGENPNERKNIEIDSDGLEKKDE
jgi:CRISPR-associated protein Cmr5